MLEETLTSVNHPPAEVAQMLINYVNEDLAAGGASSEARFFQLFTLIWQRVFGPLSPKDQKHLLGGWLSRAVKWDRPRVLVKSSLGGGPRKYTQSTSIQEDPVVKLLGVAAKASSSKDKRSLTLIEAFTKEAEHCPDARYQFPFLGLPKSMQEDWLAMLQLAIRGVAPNTGQPSENSIRLMGSLFRVKPLDQKQLLIYHQSKTQKKDQRRPLQLNPIYSPTPKSHSAEMMLSPGSTKENEDATPDVQLSMLEYYLVMFIRYPFAAPEIKATTYTSRKTEIYGESVYFELFHQYLMYYIPTRVPQGAFNGFTSPQRPSEMFVRTIIALWFEGQNQPAPTAESTKLLRDRRGYVSFDLNSSFDLIHTRFKPLPSQIVRCIHKLVNRIVSDGAIADLVKDVSEGYKGPDPDLLCMSPVMTIFQQPFYNHIRNVFRYASLHNNPYFNAAFNNWLIWLEPWNTAYPIKRVNTMSRSHGDKNSRLTQVVYPKANQRSKYKPCWEGYIASNLHLYTVPFALFLRRARELDFSPSHYQKSVTTVRKVLRIYTPEVVSVINRLLNERGLPPVTPARKFATMVRNHEKNLGPFAPPSNTLSLSSCQDDMKNLLEEISLQHYKKVEDLDFVSKTFASLFGSGAYLGEEKELHSLLHKAKIIVGFDKDYEVVPKDKKSNLSNPYDTRGDALYRTAEGSFSGIGRDKVVSGIIKCNPEDIAFIGDKMNAKVQSYEIAFLVHHLVKLSDFLNAYLGIQTADQDNGSLLSLRFNLRFLADYRNLIFLFLASYILF
jgi:hypothetical protein